MSGIVGIFRREGAPVDRELLERLTRSLGYIGPDAQQTWAGGSVGFGHTLLRNTWESATECQPGSLDERLWITADARLDCRGELEDKLKSTGCNLRESAPDSELILEAYAAWGDACVQRLRGDFSFAIWDASKRVLFCARDHFGLKPFYYADIGDLFVFGNTLNCVRHHPAVSGELNDLAIADFLMFGANYDQGTTAFRDVQRLPTAHSLVVSEKGLRLERYWTPPIDGHTRYRQPQEYVEHFQTLLRSAVADRLRTERTGVLLSGGLDSSSVAATARELCKTSQRGQELRAYTVTYEKLFASGDGDRAREVAEFLGIPIRFVSMDGLELFERWDNPELIWPEPVEDPFFAGIFDQYRMIAADCRSVLHGEGADNLMYFQMQAYTRYLIRNGHLGQALADGFGYLRSRSDLIRALGRRLQRLFRKDEDDVFPRWLAADFAKRLNLEDRWKQSRLVRAFPPHPAAPMAHASLLLPQWSQLFELANPGVTHYPVEVRYPFLDLRVVNYVLSIPPFPWAFQKTLLREAMADRLPFRIRSRRKKALARDPLTEALRRGGVDWIDRLPWEAETSEYIDRAALSPVTKETTSGSSRLAVRPLCLNFWLRCTRRVRYN